VHVLFPDLFLLHYFSYIKGINKKNKNFEVALALIFILFPFFALFFNAVKNFFPIFDCAVVPFYATVG